MKNKITFFLLLSSIFCQTNSLDIATRGANKLRMHGQMNVFHNPATLGYKSTQVKIDTSYDEVAL